MIRQGLCVLAISGLLACDVNDSAVIIGGVMPGSFDETAGGCTYEAGGTPLVSNYLDTAGSHSLTLYFSVLNNLSVYQTNVGTQQLPAVSQIGNRVTPVRYSVQWECDTSAFSGGALIVPHFSTEQGFCIDSRNPQQPDTFFGFDIVPVGGGAIAPGEEGVFSANVIPPEFGEKLDDALQVATLADSCCTETAMSNCDGSTVDVEDSSCNNLQDIFDVLTRNDGGQQLLVQSEEPNTPSPTVQRFKPFAMFDGRYSYENNLAGGRFSSRARTFPVRQRGIFELVTTDGKTLQSSEVNHKVEIGRYLAFSDDPIVCAASGQTAPCRTPAFDPCLN